MLTKMSACRRLLSRRFATSFAKIPSTPLNEKIEVPEAILHKPKIVTNGDTVSKTLPNGIKIASADLNSPICSISVAVKAGSRYENDDNFGVTHLLEKMAFKSTTETTSFSIQQQLERIGATVNCQASKEGLTYSVDVLRKFAPTALNILADVITNPAMHIHELNNAKFEYTEYLKTPSTEIQLMDDIFLAAYGMQGDGRPLTATRSNLDLMTPALLRDFVQSVAVPHNISIAAAGLSIGELEKSADEFFGNVGVGADKNLIKTPSATPYKAGELRVHDADANKDTFMTLAFPFSKGWMSKDSPALLIFSVHLGGGSSFSAGGPGKGMHSRLYQRMLANSCVNSAMAFPALQAHEGLFGVSGTCDYSHASEFSELLAKETRLAFSKPLSDEEFLRAKNSAMSSFLINLEHRASLADDICRHLSGAGEVPPISYYKKELDKVTQKDVQRVAGEMLWQKPTFAVRGNAIDTLRYDQFVAKLKL